MIEKNFTFYVSAGNFEAFKTTEWLKTGELRN
jgi:hypothetical protein